MARAAEITDNINKIQGDFYFHFIIKNKFGNQYVNKIKSFKDIFNHIFHSQSTK